MADDDDIAADAAYEISEARSRRRMHNKQSRCDSASVEPWDIDEEDSDEDDANDQDQNDVA